MGFKVNWATYGGANVTEIVRRMVKNDFLFFRVGNDIFGDPKPGEVKPFHMDCSLDDGNHRVVNRFEGEHVVFPERETRKLGVFYTYNPPGCEVSIIKSLESIKKAATLYGKEVDVVTCVWQPIPANPFPEIISWTKTLSHLNQVLQILQCLYAARSMGQYDYVSFLEHDVLYPSWYFLYPDFAEGEVMTNMNYEGVCVDGWQPRKQHDQPFHQMTMRFNDAIRHLESILPNAIQNNSGLVEPQNHKRLTWESSFPAVHINHGIHFTSHFRVYGEPTSKHHEYWGDCSKYFNRSV